MTYSMFTPMIKTIYNAEKGFVFEGPDGRKWKEDFDSDNTDITDLRECLYTFHTPIQIFHRRHLYYAGQDVFINILSVGDTEKLIISQDYHNKNNIFKFAKRNHSKIPTKYQLWDREHLGNKYKMGFFLNDKFKYWLGQNKFSDLIRDFQYAFWDGTIAESDPSQIFVTIVESRVEEFKNLLKDYIVDYVEED